jgi:hypothetical protein
LHSLHRGRALRYLYRLNDGTIVTIQEREDSYEKEMAARIGVAIQRGSNEARAQAREEQRARTEERRVALSDMFFPDWNVSLRRDGERWKLEIREVDDDTVIRIAKALKAVRVSGETRTIARPLNYDNETGNL